VLISRWLGDRRVSSLVMVVVLVVVVAVAVAAELVNFGRNIIFPVTLSYISSRPRCLQKCDRLR